MNQGIFFSIFFAGFFLAAGFLYLFIKLVKRKYPALISKPNSRDNHKGAVARGGGFVTSYVIITSIIISSLFVTEDFLDIWPVILGLIILSKISFYDDIKNLSPVIRIIFHSIAVGLGLYTLKNLSGTPGIILDGILPPIIGLIICFILWVWFINLYNFMDGIDGITGVESIFICLGIAWVSIIANLGFAPYLYSAIVIAAMLGFLIWNWHPAKIMLGDVGSVPLGFLIGFLLIYLAVCGFITSALIFPAYYLADSTFTITKRLLEGKRIWEAHSEHFYQKAVRQGKWKHSEVSLMIAGINSALVALGVGAVMYKEYQYAILLFAYFLTFSFLYILHRLKKS